MKNCARITVVLLLAFAAGQGLFAQNPKKFLKAGETFIENGNYADAIVQFSRAVELDPDFNDAYVARGLAYMEMKDFEKAKADFERALVFDDKDENILYNLGRVHNEMGEYETALNYLNRATDRAKREFMLYPEKARSLMALKDYERAVRVADTALLLKSEETAYYQRGQIYEALDNLIRARDDYEKAISKNKNYADARLALAGLALKEGKNNEAMKEIVEVLNRDDRDTRAYEMRSKIYVQQLDYPNAINDISRNIIIEPDNPHHYATRGSYYQAFNQHTNAINDFSKVIQMDSTNSDAFFQRAASYEQILNYKAAARDYAHIASLSEYDGRAMKLMDEANQRLFELNRETDKPVILVQNPEPVENQLQIPGDKEKILLSGKIQDASDLKVFSINEEEIHLEKADDSWEFVANVEVSGKKELVFTAVDVYNNTEKQVFPIAWTETAPPAVSILRPYASDNGEVFLDHNDPDVFFEGRVSDDSPIKSIFIEGVTASYRVDELNPSFTATVPVLNKNKIVVTAEDIYGNQQVQEFRLNREGAQILEDNPMGKTWVVFIDNSNYETFASLDGPQKDINLMRRALTNYQIHNIIEKKDMSKDEMERFFSIELRDLVRSNQVNSLMVWYAGHGKFINDVGYWIPVDAKRDDEFTYFNINTLKASMQAYTTILTHTLVVTDACESGPSFYQAMRSTPEIKSCDDWRATQFKSSQVFSSAGYELAVDDSQFTRTFANALSNNPDACIPIESIVIQVKNAVKQGNQQEPQFGKIAGLEDENGTFFFIAK